MTNLMHVVMYNFHSALTEGAAILHLGLSGFVQLSDLKFLSGVTSGDVFGHDFRGVMEGTTSTI